MTSLTASDQNPRRRALAAAFGGTTLGGVGLLSLGATAHAASPAIPAATTMAAAPTANPVQSGAGIAVAAAADGSAGYWTAWTDGTVVANGQALWDGDLRGHALGGRIVGIAPTPDGRGYWLVGADGGVFAFGDAGYFGSAGGLPLNAPVVGMDATPSGRGYWLVAADGGVFAFGDAAYHGSMGGTALQSPMVGVASTPSAGGYWLVAADGGVFAFGDATFRGSLGGVNLAQPVVGIASAPRGDGYWLVASDGGVFSFGTATFAGSGAARSAVPTITLAPEGPGYWLLGADGSSSYYDAPTPPATSVALGTLTAASDPAASLSPSSRFASQCEGAGGPYCDLFAWSDIIGARATEGLGPLALPPGYEQLGVTSQLAAVVNAERTSRGLAYLPESSGLDSLATAGAAAGVDPTGPAGTSWTSVLSFGYTTPLAADYEWLYNDGIGGTNVTCTASSTSGCWAHRHNLLVPVSGGIGVGAALRGGLLDLAAVLTS